MSKYWSDKKRQQKKPKDTQMKMTSVTPVKKTPREYFTAVGVPASQINALFEKEESPLNCEDCGRVFGADEKMDYGLECVYEPDCFMHSLKQVKTVKNLFS